MPQIEKASRPKRILVVDDDPMIRMLFRTVFEKQGYEVRLAASGSQALAELHAHHFDLLTLDILMPGFSGAQVQDLLSRMQGYGHREAYGSQKRLPPILIITGGLNNVPGDMLYAEGVVGVLEKPVDIKALVALVRGILGMAKTAV